ncbi:MAG: hypothetical protein GY710_03980 [Desulfobacteraceae bacterium]|nr:hypothetical protein [Desulfobacteraceae bacterium]
MGDEPELNNKRNGLIKEDLVAFTIFASIEKAATKKMVERILGVISNWLRFAKNAEVNSHHRSEVKMRYG